MIEKELRNFAIKEIRVRHRNKSVLLLDTRAKKRAKNLDYVDGHNRSKKVASTRR
eukprot:CAMPEP_0201693856 /NCGR_PEP_ID=MMETSP0578-20130828/6313_1 /ASSEMBLY_ACC=CAM_ASM_000663 /TAXON_ID=267565 /ORGANISM="Skeletonema grethea, Strain CCMP 1804" /LENGTH=54 /DNA_ID=CAMNT_0048179453 /DNA_START=118 /DNA_END=282 /DNA_ORIENTATION=+